MEPSAEKINSTTIRFTVPQPDLVYTVSLTDLCQRRDYLQNQLDIVNAQIAKAETIGVVNDADVVNVQAEVLSGDIK